MTTIAQLTPIEIEQAMYNCYPSPMDKLIAMLYFKRTGEFPFNPQWN